VLRSVRRKLSFQIALVVGGVAVVAALVLAGLELAMYDWKHPGVENAVVWRRQLISTAIEMAVLVPLLGLGTAALSYVLWIRRINHIARTLRVAEGDPVDSLTLPKARPDGDEIDLALSALSRFVLRIQHDGAELKAYLAELREIETRLHEAQSLARLGSWEYDPVNHQHWWSRQVYRIFGHNPAKPPPSLDEHLKQYHPEDLPRLKSDLARSFETGAPVHGRYRIRPDGRTVRWVESHGYSRVDADGKVRLISGTTQDITGQVEREKALQRLTRELDHRVKNNLSSVIALIRQTAGQADDVHALSDRLTERVYAMAKAHEMVSAARQHGANLSEVVGAMLSLHSYVDRDRFDCRGPEVYVTASAASPLALTLHELANNAAKHGAFARPDGRLDVRWEQPNDGLVINWRESPGQPGRGHDGHGHGSGVVENTGLDLARGFVEHQLNGRLDLDLTDEGMHITIQLPPPALDGCEPIIHPGECEAHTLGPELHVHVPPAISVPYAAD